MGRHLSVLLGEIAGDVEKRIGDYSLLREEERRQVVEEWNETWRDYPREQCVHEMFERQAELGGERVAVVRGKEQLSYAELGERANRLAHYLVSKGVRREERVGICMKRSLETVIAFLAVLKAGGAYVPLEPDYPPERLELMVKDCGAGVVLTNAGSRKQLEGVRARVIDLDECRRS
jgi:non-ribosomal peptide synthetase component F